MARHYIWLSDRVGALDQERLQDIAGVSRQSKWHQCEAGLTVTVQTMHTCDSVERFIMPRVESLEMGRQLRKSRKIHAIPVRMHMLNWTFGSTASESAILTGQ